MTWTADDLIASAKRRGVIPTAQVTWQTADFLAVADEEMLSYAVPLLQRLRQDFYIQQDDYTLAQSGSSSTPAYYRLPDRALGNTTRSVMCYDAGGNPLSLPQLVLEDMSLSTWGYFLNGSLVGYVNRTAYGAPATMRISYYLRPSRLTLVANVAKVLSFDTVAKTVTLDQLPAGYTGNGYWDIIRAAPIFETLTWDAAGALNGSTISFLDKLPLELQAGDWVTLAEVTPVPQLPPEMHPLLAQRLAVKFLEAQGDPQELQAAMAILDRMEKDITHLLTPRMQGEPKKLIPRDGVWRRWRR